MSYTKMDKEKEELNHSLLTPGLDEGVTLKGKSYLFLSFII